MRLLSGLGLAAALLMFTPTPLTSQQITPPTPVLVELFTSEGCSSCPPADALLMQIDREQPVPGALLVVLSEHVDYWNYIGWEDPWSSPHFSQRQQRYAQRLAQKGAYTPQMVVDGAYEFVGSDAGELRRAARQALARPKLDLKIISHDIDVSIVIANIESAILPVGKDTTDADLLITLARNRAASSVTRGENTGRYLPHVAVADQLVPAARIKPGEKFSGRVELTIPAGFKPEDWRIVAFLQEAGQGRVIGAAATQLTPAK